MRYLHPIAHHEKFVASGTYVTSGMKETTEEWSIHVQPGGSRFIRIDRAATPDSEHLLAEVLQSPEGIIERLDLVWFRQVVSRRVSLTAFDNYIQIGYKTEPDEREHTEFDIPPGTQLLPPFLLFTLGPVNTPKIIGNDEWLMIDVLASVNPPPLHIQTVNWIAVEKQTLSIGRKQIDAEVYEGQQADRHLKVWQDQRLHIPVRIEEQQAGQILITSELRSIAF